MRYYFYHLAYIYCMRFIGDGMGYLLVNVGQCMFVISGLSSVCGD